MSLPSPLFSCPVCQEPLIQKERTLACNQRHSYDQAKQGYWNLLLVQRKRSKDPGDNPEMVSARSRFLNQQHYKPLAEAVCRIALEQLKDIPSPKMLDMGCGEGYYTEHVANALFTKAPSLIGLDISKHAIKAACKRTKAAHWLVASGAEMPVPESSQDLLLVMFSRVMPEPFAKVVKHGGTLILIWPAQQHLIELRQAIYSQIKTSNFNPVSDLDLYFECQRQDKLTFQFSLDNNDDIEALLSMTPHSQRMAPESRAHLLDQKPLHLTFDVNIGVFSRR